LHAIAIATTSYLSGGNAQHISDKVNGKNGYVLPFDPDKEDRSAYVECLDYYLVANKVEDDAKKVAIFI